jgi:hypothetical protein
MTAFLTKTATHLVDNLARWTATFTLTIILLLTVSCNSSSNEKYQNENTALKQTIDSLQQVIKGFEFGYWSEGVGVTVMDEKFGTKEVNLGDTVWTAFGLTMVLDNHAKIVVSDSGSYNVNDGRVELLGKTDTFDFQDDSHGFDRFIARKLGKMRRYYKIIATTRNGKQIGLSTAMDFNVSSKTSKK